MENQKNLIIIEESVVSMMLIDSFALKEAAALLRKSDFTDSHLSILFETMQVMVENGKIVDSINLVEELKNKNLLENVGGFNFIQNLAQSSASAANIKSYIDRLVDNSLARKMVVACQKAISIINNGQNNIKERVYEAEKEITFVLKNYGQSGFKSAKEFSKLAIEQLIKNQKSKSTITGLDTGFKDLNWKTSGLQNSDYIIIAARPSMGKTALALNLFMQMADKNDKPVALFSLEMPLNQITNRLLATKSSIEIEKIKTPVKLSADETQRIHLASDEISKLQLYINDNPSLTIDDIVSSSRRLHADLNQDLACIIIDYIGLIKTKKRFDSLATQVSYISASLKQLARELHIPVIVLSQLSRKVESREDKRPIISDLRDSGAIEQDADIVMMLFREDYYRKDGESNNIASLNIAKHRNGPIGEITLIFDQSIGKFSSV